MKKTELNQKISQFLDDELPLDELDSVFDEIKYQQKTVQRYQLINEVVRNNETLSSSSTFLSQISAQLADEPAYSASKQTATIHYLPRWQKTAFAIAASVAVVAVMVANIDLIQQPTDIVSVETIAKVEKVESTPVMVQAKADVKSNNQLQHQRLKAYLKAHSDDYYADSRVKFRSSYIKKASY